MTANTDVSSAIVESLIPARMDRLPWTQFHTRLVMSLGTAWILDGLEITLASSVAGVLTASDTLRLSSAAVGAIATVYLVGQVVGDSMTIHACRYLAARGRHRAKDQARPDQHHTPGPRIYAGSRREAQRRHRGQRPAHPVRSI